MVLTNHRFGQHMWTWRCTGSSECSMTGTTVLYAFTDVSLRHDILSNTASAMCCSTAIRIRVLKRDIRFMKWFRTCRRHDVIKVIHRSSHKWILSFHFKFGEQAHCSCSNKSVDLHTMSVNNTSIAYSGIEDWWDKTMHVFNDFFLHSVWACWQTYALYALITV